MIIIYNANYPQTIGSSIVCSIVGIMRDCANYLMLISSILFIQLIVIQGRGGGFGSFEREQ